MKASVKRRAVKEYEAGRMRGIQEGLQQAAQQKQAESDKRRDQQAEVFVKLVTALSQGITSIAATLDNLHGVLR